MNQQTAHERQKLFDSAPQIRGQLAMNTDRQKRLQAGRKRAQKARRRESIARVVTYERWLQAGSKLHAIPDIPSDADYVIARAAGKTDRGGAR